MSHLQVTIFTSSETLAKRYRLGDTGSVEKTTSAAMYKGTYAVHTVKSMHELVALLKSVRTDQALCASLPLDGSISGSIVTKNRIGGNPESKSRSKNFFGFRAGVPALVALDYDPHGIALSQHELKDIVIEACPALANAGVIWWCSGSSFIFNGEVQHQGLRGQRLYFVAMDGGDVERFGKDLNLKFWLMGHGRVYVSSSGSLLTRGLFDAAMFKPAQLDLIGGAECEAPLSQRRGEPDLLTDSPDWVDTKVALPPSSKKDGDEFAALVQEKKDRLRSQVAVVQAEYRLRMIRERVPLLMAEGVTAAFAEERVGASIDAAHVGLLSGDFVLHIVHEDRRIEAVSVAQVLCQRDRYHEKVCLVPLNEEHRNGSPDSILYLKSASPIVFSLDDGQVFRLRQQKHHIYATKGNRGDLVEQLSSFLAAQDDIYVTDVGPVRLVDGSMSSLSKQQIQNIVSQRAVLLNRGSGGKDVPTDLAGEPAELVLANIKVTARELGLKRLTQVHSLPCVTTSGRLIASCGWDAETCAYFDLPFDYQAQVPLNPTDDDVRQAFVVLASPIRAYKWVTPDDAAGAISAFLTAVCRPFLRIAPMIVVDASTMGSGKTKFAIALGSLLTGRYEGVTPFSGINEEELRKRIMAGVLEGVPFHCLDNLVGHVRSATLSGVLTSGRLKDRKLGVSANVEGECRALMTGTANNVSLEADILRRTIRVRIDSGARPTERSFNFDPCEVALRDRTKIAEAACVIWMAFFADRAPRMSSNDAGGYADWTRLCRDPVLWAQQKGLTDLLGWQLGDPAASMMVPAEELDPDLSAFSGFLRAAWAMTDGKRFTAKDVATWFHAGEGAAANDTEFDLREAVLELLPLGARKEISSRAIGSALKFRHDRHAGGLVLRQRVDRSANSNLFYVEMTPEQQ